MDKNKNSARRFSDLSEEEENGLLLLVRGFADFWHNLDDTPFGMFKRLIERSYREAKARSGRD